MQSEYDALIKNGTWTLVDLPSHKMAIGCKWVFGLKQNPYGFVNKYKARLVAKGFHQRLGHDYNETFSPVIKPTTKVVARSSTKAEYRSLAPPSVEVAWIQTLLFELQVRHTAPVVFCDNMITVALAHHPVLHSRTKHMELELFFVREKVMEKSLQVIHVPAIDQYVDILTKSLSPSNFTIFKDKLRVVDKTLEARAVFVFFKSRFGAASAFHLQLSVNPTHWITELAPEPRDVYWPFFSESFTRRWISKLVVVLVCTTFTVVFLIPVVIVQGLTNLNQLEILFPFLTSITIKFVSQIVTGYLPSLILQLFLKLVPPAMEFLSSIQGYISHSDIEMSASRKVLWFTVWHVFFATVLSGSILSMLNAVLDPKSIPGKLAVAVPAQASFFITYVVTQGWTSVSSELFRVIPFIFSWITRPFTSQDDEFEVPSTPYHKDIPRVLFFGLLGITYFFLAPLILPFLLAYFCLAYIIFRNQFINVYAPKYDTAGKFWPIIHNSMIFSLVLMHIIAVGIFALKKLSLASTLTMPLPVLTLLFNEYCRKRFLPIFAAYSAESLIKKDRQDQNDATMTQFYENLVNAYKDPALLPIQHSPYNNDSIRSPLISQA
ncbi:CSC1-like protein At1g69450 [Glycine soja]|nr:CSC1-like protein At1g69450 [Glycine max]XP_028233856.1 CSC1-like protein At1g69450 [Glycine soja]|eukprot:XP_014633436.1 CSC1-like protein At1g69450 [Glycine max]